MPVRGVDVGDEPDITDEVLRDLDPRIRTVLREAIEAGKVATQQAADPILGELREIRLALVSVVERSARVEERQAAADLRAVEARAHVDRLERRLDGQVSAHRLHVEAMLGEIKNEILQIRTARGVAYDAIAVACRSSIELVRLLAEKPAVLGTVLLALVVLAGLAAIGAGGALSAAWGDVKLGVTRGADAPSIGQPEPEDQPR